MPQTSEGHRRTSSALGAVAGKDALMALLTSPRFQVIAVQKFTQRGANMIGRHIGN